MSIRAPFSLYEYTSSYGLIWPLDSTDPADLIYRIRSFPMHSTLIVTTFFKMRPHQFGFCGPCDSGELLFGQLPDPGDRTELFQ